MDVKKRLRRVEELLVHTMTIEDAREIINKETEILKTMKDDGEHEDAAMKGIIHLKEYLLDYWTTDSLWQGWSDFGQRMAASILKCPFEGVLPTTNHLESFNGLLKRKHLRRWQHGGRRLRLDVLLKLLVTKVLPAIFEQRKMEQFENQRWEAQMRNLPGGEALLSQRNTRKAIIVPVAYLVPDDARDRAAAQILENKQIAVPEVIGGSLIFDCYSSLAVPSEENPIIYRVSLSLDGSAACSCADFTKRGGACKHIRSALLRLQSLRLTHPHLGLPEIALPKSIDEARLLQSRNMAMNKEGHASPIECAAAVIDDILRETDDILFVADNSQVASSEHEYPSEADDETVDTDADDDAIDDEFKFPSLLGFAKVAVDEQAIARTFYDFERIFPKLNEWQEYLKMVTALRQVDRDRAIQFKDQLESLLAQLHRLIDTVAPSSQSTSPATHSVQQGVAIASTQTLPSLTPSRKRLSNPIIGPSPEKASKRFKSYGHH
jgi:hypothetical protein